MPRKLKISLLLLVFVFLLTSGFSCKLFPKNEPPKKLTENITLNFWGVWENNSDFKEIISDFNKVHPNIKVSYRKFRYQEYEQKLLEAWAEDRGPDLYSLPAEWLKKYKNRITPQPGKVQLAFQEVKKTLGKTEINTILREVPIIKSFEIKGKFVDTVYNDVIIDGKIYGLPLSVDSLALFYNRDILDAAGLPTPPTNWTEIKEATKKITLLNKDNELAQAGIALGTANNISNAVDIVSLIMMQLNTPMLIGKGVGFFNPASGSKDKSYLPGIDALQFYTSFADPIKETYSWNEKMPNALDAFISGKTAMIYGYSYELSAIRGRAPKLNFDIAPMTQMQGANKPLNFTNYWVTTVSHKTKNIDAAWGFLNFAASETEVKKYLNATKRPAALRGLLTSQTGEPQLGIFAEQALTAAHWYNGNDPLKMEEIFSELITQFPKITNDKELKAFTDSIMKKINLTL
jgi:multiple sugar transport system substrate-binding protein